MFVEMLKIRWYDLTGKYDGNNSLPPQPAKAAPEGRGRQI
jgi:hypothetical protein